MIAGKSLEELQWNDILIFLGESRKEGWTLEYKGSETKNILKSACSLANTFGGYIVIGVNEENGLPVPPFEGLPSGELTRTESAIRDSLLSNTYPVLNPKIKSIFNSDMTRGFLLLQVHRTSLSPYVLEDKHIYRRFRDRNNPEYFYDDRADFEWLEHMLRTKAPEWDYFNSQKSHFLDILEGTNVVYAGGSKGRNQPGSYHFLSSPKYQAAILEDGEFEHSIEDLRSRPIMLEKRDAYSPFLALKSVDGGYYRLVEKHFPNLAYFGEQGLVGFFDVLLSVSDDVPHFDILELSSNWDAFLKMMWQYYQKLGIDTHIVLEVEILNILGLHGSCGSGKFAWADHIEDRQLLNRIRFRRDGLASELLTSWQPGTSMKLTQDFLSYLKHAFSMK